MHDRVGILLKRPTRRRRHSPITNVAATYHAAAREPLGQPSPPASGTNTPTVPGTSKAGGHRPQCNRTARTSGPPSTSAVRFPSAQPATGLPSFQRPPHHRRPRDGVDRTENSTPRMLSLDKLKPLVGQAPTPAMSARRTTPDSTSTRLFSTPVRRAIIQWIAIRWTQVDGHDPELANWRP